MATTAPWIRTDDVDDDHDDDDGGGDDGDDDDDVDSDDDDHDYDYSIPVYALGSQPKGGNAICRRNGPV